MVQGLAFLSKKAFNPKNLSNQKRVWEARQQNALDEKKARERSQQLQREKDEEELARIRDGSHGAAKSTLKFMYDAPPIKDSGKTASNSQGNSPPATSTENNDRRLSGSVPTASLLQRQPGDDDAAAAFRQMLATAAAVKEEGEASVADTETRQQQQQYSFSNSSGAALQGSTVSVEETKKNAEASALEKAVGRRTAAGMTLEEQIARFPQLKDAPMAKGMTSTNVNVSFKPLGTQLRNVRCLACGVWGHSRGDRECGVSGWDPFASSRKGILSSGPSGSSSIRATTNKKQPLPAGGMMAELSTTKMNLKRKQNDREEDSGRRKKKSSRRRRDDSDSESVESESSSEERRRRRKKERKHRRRHRRRKEERRRMKSKREGYFSSEERSSSGRRRRHHRRDRETVHNSDAESDY